MMKIVRSNEVEWAAALQTGRYGQRRKPLSDERLSASLWELAPGKRSFPLHVHHVTEEALFVVSGRGKVRTPAGETEVAPGDYVSFPAGGVAHQLVNDGDQPLVYLGLSTNAVGVDVVEYPESGKVASAVGRPPAGKRFIFRAKDQVGYLDGEE